MIMYSYTPSLRDKFYELLAINGMSLEFEKDLPGIGYICFPEHEKSPEELGPPIAAGFIRLMENDYGVMDSFITHRRYASDMRSAALDMIMKKLVLVGRDVGLKKLLAFSLESSLIKRACDLGFTRIPYEMAAHDLGEG